jgi:hypothetical protein
MNFVTTSRSPTGRGVAAKPWSVSSVEGSVDRYLMHWLVLFSSSEAARRAGARWLAAFEAARASGASEDQAEVCAREAWRMVDG